MANVDTGDNATMHVTVNEGMNANNWFADSTNPVTPKALYRYNYFDYQIGGPIQKNKLFFFWSQEYYRQLIPVAGLDEFRTPTALERTGDFSQSPFIIYNPATGQPFPGNKIDPSTLSAAQQDIFNNVSKLMSLYALPNIANASPTGVNYATQPSYNDPRHEDIFRVDYQINEKNRLSGRWVHNSEQTTAPMETNNLSCDGQLQLPGGCIGKSPSWNLSLDLTSTLRSNLLNEFSVGPSVTRSSWAGNNGNLSVGANNISLPMLYHVPPTTSIPDMGFGGNGGAIPYPWSYFGANPWYQANTTINLNDNVTWVERNHTFKFGLFYQRNRKDQIAWGNSNGQFTIDNCATSSDPVNCSDNNTGMAYASALLGYFRNFDQTSARPIGFFRYNQLEFYAQDTFKITPRLTLDYGMRFVWIPPQYDAKNQIALFKPEDYDSAKAVQIDPSDGSIVPGSGDLTDGYAFTDNGSLPQGGWNSRGIMPEPRFGFAYQLTSDQKTVLRGGFGTSHDREQGNLVFNTVFADPANVITPTVLSGNMLDISSLPQQAPGVLGSVYGADQTGKVPVVYSYNLGIQRELARGTTLDVAYVGTLGRHLVTQSDINSVPFGTTFTRAAQDPSQFPGGVVPAVEPNLPPEYAAAGYDFSGAYAYTTNYLVPYKGYQQIFYYKFDGISNYNSLQVSLQRRFSRNLTFGAAYTYSHVLTTASEDQDTQYTEFTHDLTYRNADWDRRHVLAINYVYSLPSFSKHLGGAKWLSYVTDNFQISGVPQFETGAPTPDYNTYGGCDMAIWVPGNQLTGSEMWGALPPAFTGLDAHGNLELPKLGLPFTGSRSDLRDGGMQNWDISIFKNILKNIPLGSNEERYIQLRGEALNIFNHRISTTRSRSALDVRYWLMQSITPSVIEHKSLTSRRPAANLIAQFPFS